MVAQRQLHTFVIRHTPPEGDLLDEEELAGMDHEEGLFVAQIFRYGMMRIRERFRKKVARALTRRLPADSILDAQTSIGANVVELRVTCALEAAEDETVLAVNDLLGDLVPRAWERAANPPRR